MKLHRANGNDWDEVAIADRTVWQRYAARTQGYITPANAVTIFGSFIALTGLYVLALDVNTMLGVSLLLVGRLADLFDGVVADYTGTKSPIGEAVDATADKVVLAASVMTLWIIQLLPTAVFGFLALHAVYNVLLFGWALFTAQRLHPSRNGKLAAALEWVVVLLFASALGIGAGLTRHAILGLAWIGFVAFVIFAVHSSQAYTTDLRKTS
ncbi:CDP-alcohol phosphatidyltransferase family protein [Aeromicrobium sp.]|nr:CDP-alcohol phosphatidyltransferase family protein [Candidatus Saccharibacteria bacterium]